MTDNLKQAIKDTKTNLEVADAICHTRGKELVKAREAMEKARNERSQLINQLISLLNARKEAKK